MVYIKKGWNKNSAFKKGELNPKWKGGRIKTPSGYIMILKPEHPRGKSNMGYVFEHILIIEKKLGKFLKKNKIIHHINGIRDDNRIENLIVITRREHSSEHKKKYWDKKGRLTEKEKKEHKRIIDKRYKENNKERINKRAMERYYKNKKNLGGKNRGA